MSDAGVIKKGGYFSGDNAAKFDVLKTDLNSGNTNQVMSAMKMMIGMISKGRDAADLFPYVVKNIVSSSLEVKKLVYIYLVRYAEAEPDVALLSVNTFQKDQRDRDQFIRSSALRVLSSIRVETIIPLVILQTKQAAKDMSPYVRKTAVHALEKIYTRDQTTKDELIEVLEDLLKDRSPLVLSSAVIAFEEICPERIDIIHGLYRRLCKYIMDLEEWGQVAALQLLMRYARSQFVRPDQEGEELKERNFYSSDDDDDDDDDDDEDGEARDQKVSIDMDYQLLLRSVLPLLMSRNTAVVMGVVQLYFYVAPQLQLGQVIRPLLRILRGSREMVYVALQTCEEIAKTRPDVFQSHISAFYVKSSDPTFIRVIKLNVLCCIANETNAGRILGEFETYVNSTDEVFVSQVITGIGQCAAAIPDIFDTCMQRLLGFIRSTNQNVVSESVVVIKSLLQLRPKENKDIIPRLALLFDSVKATSARAAILWAIGEFAEENPRIGPDVLRVVLKTFHKEDLAVKMQTLNLAGKLMLCNPEQTKLLYEYTLNLTRYDTDYDIRDRARFIDGMLNNEHLKAHGKRIIKCPRPTPKLNDATPSDFRIGTLSVIVDKQVEGYESLPDFPEVAPDTSELRNVPEPKEYVGLGANSPSVVKLREADTASFYDDDDDDSSSEEGSSTEEEDSDFYGEDSEDSDESSDEESSDDDEDDEDDDDDEGLDDDDDDDGDDDDDDDDDDDNQGYDDDDDDDDAENDSEGAEGEQAMEGASTPHVEHAPPLGGSESVFVDGEDDDEESDEAEDAD